MRSRAFGSASLSTQRRSRRAVSADSNSQAAAKFGSRRSSTSNWRAETGQQQRGRLGQGTALMASIIGLEQPVTRQRMLQGGRRAVGTDPVQTHGTAHDAIAGRGGGALGKQTAAFGKLDQSRCLAQANGKAGRHTDSRPLPGPDRLMRCHRAIPAHGRRTVHFAPTRAVPWRSSGTRRAPPAPDRRRRPLSSCSARAAPWCAPPCRTLTCTWRRPRA